MQYTSRHYSLFTYFGSSNFFGFLLHNESLWRNCFVQLMYCTSTFWKCVWFENMGSITKVMNVKVKNVTWRFCPFLHLESSDGVSQELLPISTPGLEKSAAIRPFATKKSRLASEKILLADSLATESCRLADRLATKLSSVKAGNADADRTWSRKVFGRRLCRSKMQGTKGNLAIRARRSCLRVNPPPGAFPEILLPRPSELCGVKKISYALWLSVCGAH